jgi:heme exporter protein A
VSTASAPQSDTDPLDFHVVDALDVSRHFGRRRALSHVTLSFRGGEIVGLLGPNGAGKSTLLAILSTLAQPSGGEVRYGRGTARELGDALRARIGVLGHDLFLYGDLTARENLLFFARLYGIRDPAARVDESLAHARLESRQSERVAAFSRGLRQRLALERALLHRPRLILLDEPFTGLDDDSAHLLIARLQGLRATGAIVVMATHDFETAESLLDRAVCLTNGRAVELDLTAGGGSLRALYRAATSGLPHDARSLRRPDDNARPDAHGKGSA